MKYAIYDKAADGYLTKLEFENDVPVQTLGLICGYNEYITEAKLLDTKEEAVAVVTRIESNKFMEKGRFVMHSFDEKLADQYIISETRNPTKVVDSITVDLDGNINVKYGTMLTHWSTKFLEYAINRMNALQKAKSPKYTAWCNTFDIYKVITVTDERSCNHYQFIKVTENGLTEYAKNEVDPLNKRIEELERANYDLDQQSLARGLQADRLKEENDRLKEENDNLKIKVEAIKKEASNWKQLYGNADSDRYELKIVIDTVYNDLKSPTACDDLKGTLKALTNSSGLDHITMPTKAAYILDNGICLTAKDEIHYIVNQMITIIESRELNQSVAFASADEVEKARVVAYDITAICQSDDNFERTLKKFSQLYEAMGGVTNIDDDPIMHAFWEMLLIFSTMDRKLTDFVDEIYDWKSKAQKAEKDLDDQKKLNDANKATIARMVVIKSTADKRIKELRNTRGSMAEVMFAIRNAICNNNSDAFDCIESRMEHDSIFNSSPFMAGVRENIKDICTAEKKNIANHELKNGEITRLANEKKQALERAEFYKRQANSVYEMIVPTRCCGKQLMADILSGKKIPISKDKYDDLVECVNNINITYDILKCADFTMNKPVWFDGIINRIKNLTE